MQIPYDIRISFAVGSGGSPAKRSDLLAQLELAVQSLDFYSVITPEAVYTKANLVHMEYSRESKRGVNLLVVEVWVQEVRPAAGNAFTKTEGIQNPQTAAADNPTNSGGVQADDAPFDVPTDTSASGVANDPNSLFLPAAGSDIGGSQDMPSLGSAGRATGTATRYAKHQRTGIAAERHADARARSAVQHTRSDSDVLNGTPPR